MKAMSKFTRFSIMSGLIVLAFSVAATAQSTKKSSKPKTQTAKVLISEKGYEPGSLKLKRGVPAKITFLRTTDRTCGTEIVIPAYGINKPLPLNEKVLVSFTPTKTGEYGFTCGMDMMRGKLIIQ
jgi:plastocyanin domain-containing protein